MILRLALRSLAVRPWRTAVLAAGFGLGIAVMVALLGGGEVIIEQAHSPALLVADEPTGELDEETGDHVAALFDRVHADGTAILLVTHNPLLALRASRRLAMRNGSLVP